MIKQVDNPKDLRQEISARISGGVLTNFYMSEEEYTTLIAQGRLFRQDFSGGVYLLIKFDDRTELFYFLQKDITLPLVEKFDDTLVLSVVHLAKRGMEPSAQAWEAIGFEPYIERKRLFLASKKIEASDGAIEVTFATRSNLDAIHDFMQTSFEPLTSALLTKEELLEEILGERIIVELDEDEIIGFLHFETKRKNSFLWHIAVSPEARGKGIAGRLVQEWLELEKEKASKFTLWVRTDNPSALKLYEKAGFLPDGRVAPVMIIK